ncbi:MAG: type II secretion system F family protein [Calditrichaeota bacterium]|nr:type II secretion system F family protein [Calditrichota bacterium]MCB9368536.1 type II secretion system F family protein [Calditrichota bacterium]
MPVFLYTGRGAGSKSVNGEIEATDKQEAMAKLRQRRVVVSELRTKPKDIKVGGLGGGVGVKDLKIFARLFGTMINAGLPIDQCIQILVDQMQNKRFRRTIAEIHNQVAGGESLSEAMSKHKDVFDNLFVHMVAAGETGGALAMVFNRLAVYLEKADALRRKVKGAMIYPAVIACVAIGATVFLLIKVIPVFANMFKDLGAELPKPTQFVLALSDVMQKTFLPGLGVLVVAFIVFKKWHKTANGKASVDKFLLKTPVIGSVIRKTAVARFTRTLGVLISSGVPILHGLEITAKTAGNVVIQKAVDKVRKEVSEGRNITQPLMETAVFPAMVCQLIAVGEQTGRLAEMLEKIADFYDEEVDAAVAAMTSLIEPIVIVLMGAVIGGLLVSMYLPMFDMIGAIK